MPDDDKGLYGPEMDYPLEDIVVNYANNPRGKPTPEAVYLMMIDILRHGQIDAGVADPGPDAKPVLRVGFHRFDALKAAGRKAMRLKVAKRPLTPSEIRSLHSSTNIVRTAMNCWEQTLMVLEEAAEKKISLHLACQLLSVQESLVSKTRWIREYPLIIEAVKEKRITAEQVALLGRIPEARRLEIFARLTAEDGSERWQTPELKAAAKALSGERKKKGRAPKNGRGRTNSGGGEAADRDGTR